MARKPQNSKPTLRQIIGTAATIVIIGYAAYQFYNSVKEELENPSSENTPIAAYTLTPFSSSTPGTGPIVNETPESPLEEIASSGTDAESDNSTEYLKLCSWNIQNIGQSKMKEPEVMATIADVLIQCDITAVQEVSDKSGQVMAALVYEYINGSGKSDSTFDFELSPRIGENRSSSNAEQYAYVYNADKISVKRDSSGKMAYVHPDGESGDSDIFAREPYVVAFKYEDFDFALATVHTKPEAAKEEICALVDVIELAEEKFQEGDVIALGDYNSDGSYWKENKETDCLRDPKYMWLIGDSIDTTVSVKNANTYDRIVGKQGFLAEDFTGQSGVYYFEQDQAEGSPFVKLDTTLETKEYSDHYPVWALFYPDKDTH